MTAEDSAHIVAPAKALLETVGVRLLSDIAVLEIAGDDAQSWLNGQMTNDVALSKPGDATYGFVINVKGKILTDVWALHGQDGFQLLVYKPSVEALLPHFDKYIIMEDVEVTPRPDLSVLTVQGPLAGKVVGEHNEAFPCNRLGTVGFDLVVASKDAHKCLHELAAAAAKLGGCDVSEAGWELVRLRLGVPRMGVDFDERSYPQQTGLKERAISFNKGCYLGQEVVCMIESRGQVSKTLTMLTGTQTPGVGTTVEDSDGKEVGRITSATWDPAGKLALAIGLLKASAAEVGHVVMASESPLEVVSTVAERAARH